MNDPRKTTWWKSMSLESYFRGEKAKPFVELCVLASMIAAGADGTASESEYDHIVTLVDLATNGEADRDALDDLVAHATRALENDGMDKLIEDLGDRGRGMIGLRKAALAFALACSYSDGVYTDEEREVIGKIAKALDVEGSLDEIRTAIAAG